MNMRRVGATSWASPAIASRNGKPIATPAPRRTVLRESLVIRKLLVSAMPEGMAPDDLDDEAGEAVAVLPDRRHDLLDRADVVVVRLSPQGERHQVPREGPHEVVRATSEDRLLELRGAVEAASVGKSADRVDVRRPVLLPPDADGVVVLEREAERIDLPVAGRAARIGPVALQLLPHARPVRRRGL